MGNTTRRRLLKTGSVAFSALIAGCNDGGGYSTDRPSSDDTPSSTPSGSSTDEETETPTASETATSFGETEPTPEPDLEVLGNSMDPSDSLDLPPVWSQYHSLDDFRKRFQFSATAENTELETVELLINEEAVQEFSDADGETWDTVTDFTPSDLETGENDITLRATTAAGNQEGATDTVTKEVPNSFKVDFVFGENQELRADIDFNADGDYLELSGTVDDPQYAQVSNSGIVDEVWSDSEGQFRRLRRISRRRDGGLKKGLSSNLIISDPRVRHRLMSSGPDPYPSFGRHRSIHDLF